MRVKRDFFTPGPVPGRPLFAAVLLWLATVLMATALADTGAGDNALAEDIKQLQNRVDTLQARDDIEPAVRERVAETYKQAIAALNSAQSNRDQSAELRDEARDAPARIRELKARRKALVQPSAADELGDKTVVALSSRADTISARLADTQATLSDLRDQLARLAKRPEAARNELDEAREALQALENAAGADSRAAGPLAEAERALGGARRESITSEIARLQQELSSVDSRGRVLEARRALAEARLGRDTQALAAVQRALGERQSDTARSLRRDSEQKLDELRGVAPPIGDAAQRNVELARRLTEVIDQSETLADRQVRQRKRVEDIKRRLNLVQRQLDIGGRSVALGDVLRDQQRHLAEPAWEAGGPAPGEVPDVAAAELQRFQLQQAQASLDDIPEEVSSIVRHSAQESDTAMNAGERQSLTALLRQRRVILEQLIDAESRFIDIGRDLRALAQQYDNSLAAFNRLLDERLFWLPSFAAVPLDWFGQVARDLPWAFDPTSWWRALSAIGTGVGNRPYLAALGLFVIGVLVGARRFFKRRLRRLAEPVGNVRHDTFWVTLRAALVTVFLAVPQVLALLLVAWLMRQTNDPEIFTLAVAAGVVQIATLMLFIEPFAQVCRPNGLAECHFLWTDEARAGLQRMLRWLLLLLLLPSLLIAMAEAFDDEARRQTIGRAAFMFGSLAIAWFSWRLLHPVRGALADVLGSDTKSHWRLGYLWLPLAVGLPLLLCGLAASGYYYTALQLQTRFFYSAGLLGGCRVFYSLIVRWLTVAERRLALTRALRKREEAREARATREAAAAAGEGTPDNLDTVEIDLVQISEQTRGLIQVVITLIVAAGLWLIWADTLPALQLLDDVVLWRYATELDGATQLTNVTLGSLMLAVGVGVITALAGRNLPGFLEITVLRRFSMEAGSRYAMATLFQYAIVIIGLLVAVGLIGLRWSSIQWLVAALGVGLGFGLQEIFANFVSGIVILFERPVRVGDTVTVGTLTGTVSRIRIRATTVTDWDNKEVVIPNKTFITETVINWTLTDDITRLIIRVHLALDTDTDLAEQLIMEAIQAEPVALETPAPSVFMVGYDDSALQYEARVFYHDLYNLLPLQHALYKRIHAAFAAHDVVVSFPQQDLHLRSVDDSFARFIDKRREQSRDDDAGDNGTAPA